MVADPPSSFVSEWVARVAGPAPRQRALDVAMGRGRHTLLLARRGYRAFGVDRNFDAVQDARERAAGEALEIITWCADLEISDLPRAQFELLVVTRYLQRDLFPAIRNTVAPGGMVLYETFTEAQRALGWGPRSPVHLLKPGELRSSFDGFDVLFYEEVNAPEAVARLVARRPHA
jgi:SAM-dependent methyltransferase